MYNLLYVHTVYIHYSAKTLTGFNLAEWCIYLMGKIFYFVFHISMETRIRLLYMII